jgi:hypothetical protein
MSEHIPVSPAEEHEAPRITYWESGSVRVLVSTGKGAVKLYDDEYSITGTAPVLEHFESLLESYEDNKVLADAMHAVAIAHRLPEMFDPVPERILEALIHDGMAREMSSDELTIFMEQVDDGPERLRILMRDSIAARLPRLKTLAALSSDQLVRTYAAQQSAYTGESELTVLAELLQPRDDA